MNTEILESLGFSPNEAKIYESLLENGESSISEIAVASGTHRRNVYDAIQRLINKGLCFQIFSANENTYNAVDPNKLVELLVEKHDKLFSILPSLKKKFATRATTEEAYIYKGLEGQKNIFRDVLRVEQDSYFIGAKGGWYDSRLDSARTAFFEEANKKKIRFIQLFDYEVKSQMKDFPKYFEGKLEHRFLPKEYSTNSAIHIFGDYVITYTGLTIGKVGENTVFFVIHSRDLAESYRTWFWYMWGQSSNRKTLK